MIALLLSLPACRWYSYGSVAAAIARIRAETAVARAGTSCRLRALTCRTAGNEVYFFELVN